MRHDQPVKRGALGEPISYKTTMSDAHTSTTLRQAMPHGIPPEQMVFCMQEITEITLLDYSFRQQDRIGNIDYLTYRYCVDKGEIKRMPSSSTRVPDEIAEHHPIRLRRTQLNDNDAGGRVTYANFTKQTGMLEKIRHHSSDTYRRLVRLADDFAAQGELFRYVRETFRLSERQLKQIVANTGPAAGILRATCKAGKLRFDLDPAGYLVTGKVKEQKVNCDNP